jgi:hypothetical protein
MEKLAETLADIRIALREILENSRTESEAVSDANRQSCTGPKIVVRRIRESDG